MTRKNIRNISRRDTLKVCLVPVGAITTRWLSGCANEAQSTQPLLQTAGSQANATGSGGAVAALNGGTSAGSTVATIGGSSAGQSVAAGSGSPSAGAGTGQSGSGSAGQAQQPSAGSAGRANAGTSAGSSSAAGSGGAGTSSAAGSGGAGAAAAGSAGGSVQAGSGAVAAPSTAWATGGTKAMQGNYPDPFTSGNAGAACMLYPAQTIGPCYAQMPSTRSDISDGLGGLPLRLSFQVVRGSTCMPIQDASIDIWHSGSDGIYSAYATGTICNPGMMDVRSKMFCRGVQMTDASGRADFSTVFPGWYTGRTIHIHFTLRVNGREAVTSQIYFEDALTEEILAQGDYSARGKRDTTNATDMLFRSGGATPAQVLFSTAKRPDGVLHAWKTLSIG